MLLRLTVPLLEIPSASVTQLRPRFASCGIALLKQRAYSSHKHPFSDWESFPDSVHSDSTSPQVFREVIRISPREQRSVKPKIKLLTPHELSQRVDSLCLEGELSAAISLVKNAPLDAQNAIVWATLIRSVIGRKRYHEAYRLFIDMKRRGIRPTSRTFSTLLKGYTQIVRWEQYPLQLENVCRIYDQLKQHHEMIRRTTEPDLSNIPYNLLISIFGRAQQFQRMFDVFNAMPSQGPLAPDIQTFTSIITALANRQPAALSDTPANEDGDESHLPALPTATELAHKNASDARLMWRQLLRVCGSPDSYAIHAILKPLSRGRPSDQDFALDIAHEYLGLSRPGEQSLPSKLPLHEMTLEGVLLACNAARRYRYTLHYIQQVIDSDRASILNTKHMDMALEAHAALACMDPGESEQALETLQWMLRMQALPQTPFRLGIPGGIGSQIKPKMSTYNLVALACWNGGDWTSACRAFELMTGCSQDEFRGKMLIPKHGSCPSGLFMSSFIKTATKTNDLKNIHQALNILEHYGVETVINEVALTENNQDHVSNVMPRRRSGKQTLYASKLLAEALRMVVPQMLESVDFGQVEKSQWKSMLSTAEELCDSWTVAESVGT